MSNMSARDEVLSLTRSTGVLPAIKLKEREDLLPFVQAMYDGGARVVEITMTTPGVLEAFEAIKSEFGQRLYLGAGTVLDPPSARAAILAGARLIVSPALVPEVIATAHRYGAACYSGAFTASECLAAMQAGADMIKVFPAALGGPRYMTNLRMVFPEISLIPSGGISLENAAEYIQCGACAISGSRNFMDRVMVEQHGLNWVTDRIAQYIAIVAKARGSAHPLP